MKLSSRTRWGLSVALVSLLAGQEVCTAAHHRLLHGEQEAVTVKDGALRSTDGTVYFSVQPYGQGIVNAQLSVLKGLEAAKRHGYTFVVPPMIQWWAEHDPSYLLILPFSHFYDQQHFQSFADDYGVEIAWELPASRHAACTLQTQLSDKSPQAVNKATHRAWAAEYGVICLGGNSAFFTIDGADEPQFWPPDGLRAALQPSEVYEREVERMLEEVERQHGTREFVGVHARVEGDWEQQCRGAQNRTDPGTMLFGNKHGCWMDEGSIAEVLEKKLKVKPGSLLFLQTTTPMKKLPRLCSRFRCFTRDSVWTDRSDEIPHKQTSLVLSYLTSLLAEHASAMYGNIHSAYFGELAKRFAAANKPSHHLNPDCPEIGLCS